MMDIVYFSSTGNVEYLAQRLADALYHQKMPARTLRLERVDPNAVGVDGHLLLMYPVHGFNPPRNVRHFAKQLTDGPGRRVSLVSVGCAEHWVNTAASRSLRKILQHKGYLIQQDELLAMPSNFLIGFTDETCEQLISRAEDRIKQIAATLHTGHASDPALPLKSKIMSWLGRIQSVGARLFGLDLHANADCNTCGLCVMECPVSNIHFNKANRPVFGLDCLMCLRCIYDCPEKAISPRLYRFVPIKGGYSIRRYRD